MSAGDGRRQMWAEWISVKDRLPPCAEIVLVYVPERNTRLRAFHLCSDYGRDEYERMATGWHEDADYGNQPRILHKVTHWMELPEAPGADDDLGDGDEGRA